MRREFEATTQKGSQAKSDIANWVPPTEKDAKEQFHLMAKEQGSGAVSRIPAELRDMIQWAEEKMGNREIN